MQTEYNEKTCLFFLYRIKHVTFTVNNRIVNNHIITYNNIDYYEHLYNLRSDSILLTSQLQISYTKFNITNNSKNVFSALINLLGSGARGSQVGEFCVILKK